MRIGIDTMKADGRRVRVTLADAWASAAAREALDGPPEALEADLCFQLVKRQVRVTGAASARATLPCHRCGESVSVTVEQEVDLVYHQQVEPPHGEHELSEDELDLGWFSGDAVEAADVLSEALALAVPVRIVCNDTDACDVRTQALLGTSGAGAAGHPGFSALAGILRDV